MRKTWLERNSSVETVSAALEPGAASASREESSTSVVGTKRMWCWTGLHCEGKGLLKKAARNGFRGCIHSTGDPRRPLGRSALTCKFVMAGIAIGARRMQLDVDEVAGLVGGWRRARPDCVLVRMMDVVVNLRDHEK